MTTETNQINLIYLDCRNGSFPDEKEASRSKRDKDQTEMTCRERLRIFILLHSGLQGFGGEDEVLERGWRNAYACEEGW